MSFTIRDGISPELLRMARTIRDHKPVLEAMGLRHDTSGRALDAAVQKFRGAKNSGRGKGILARPFFPFTGQDAVTALAAERMRRAAFAKVVRLLRG